MNKITIGQEFPVFSCATPFSPSLSLEDALKRVPGKTALVFLRYYGCPICQLDLRDYAEGYGKITASGGQLLVVLQSDPKLLAEKITPETFPFDIFCDPQMELYQQLAIAPAASMLKMMSFSAVKKVIRSNKMGFKHGEYEGNEQQLPAAFVLDQSRKVHFAHYGRDAADVPTAEELAALLK